MGILGGRGVGRTKRVVPVPVRAGHTGRRTRPVDCTARPFSSGRAAKAAARTVGRESHPPIRARRCPTRGRTSRSTPSRPVSDVEPVLLDPDSLPRPAGIGRGPDDEALAAERALTSAARRSPGPHDHLGEQRHGDPAPHTARSRAGRLLEHRVHRPAGRRLSVRGLCLRQRTFRTGVPLGELCLRLRNPAAAQLTENPGRRPPGVLALYGHYPQTLTAVGEQCGALRTGLLGVARTCSQPTLASSGRFFSSSLSGGPEPVNSTVAVGTPSKTLANRCCPKGLTCHGR